jgi:hypothetical protein
MGKNLEKAKNVLDLLATISIITSTVIGVICKRRSCNNMGH